MLKPEQSITAEEARKTMYNAWGDAGEYIKCLNSQYGIIKKAAEEGRDSCVLLTGREDPFYQVFKKQLEDDGFHITKSCNTEYVNW